MGGNISKYLIFKESRLEFEGFNRALYDEGFESFPLAYVTCIGLARSRHLNGVSLLNTDTHEWIHFDENGELVEFNLQLRQTLSKNEMPLVENFDYVYLAIIDRKNMPRPELMMEPYLLRITAKTVAEIKGGQIYLTEIGRERIYEMPKVMQ